MLADVVFPLFFTPYAMAFLLPVYGIAALLAEIVTFCGLQFRAAPLWQLVIAVLVANLVSTAVGFPLTAFLPSPAQWGKTLAVCSFPLLWALSIAIEYGVYYAVPRWRRLPHLFRTVVIANSVGYAILLVAMFHAWH